MRMSEIWFTLQAKDSTAWRPTVAGLAQPTRPKEVSKPEGFPISHNAAPPAGVEGCMKNARSSVPPPEIQIPVCRHRARQTVVKHNSIGESEGYKHSYPNYSLSSAMALNNTPVGSPSWQAAEAPPPRWYPGKLTVDTGMKLRAHRAPPCSSAQLRAFIFLKSRNTVLLWGPHSIFSVGSPPALEPNCPASLFLTSVFN